MRCSEMIAGTQVEGRAVEALWGEVVSFDPPGRPVAQVYEARPHVENRILAAIRTSRHALIHNMPELAVFGLVRCGAVDGADARHRPQSILKVPRPKASAFPIEGWDGPPKHTAVPADPFGALWPENPPRSSESVKSAQFPGRLQMQNPRSFLNCARPPPSTRPRASPSETPPHEHHPSMGARRLFVDDICRLLP